MPQKDQTSRERDSPLNRASAEYLRTVKAAMKPRPSNQKISEMTGIGYEQVRRLLNNEATFSMDEFLGIAGAFDVDPVQALQAVLTKVESQTHTEESIAGE